jgi:hypothetical protein
LADLALGYGNSWQDQFADGTRRLPSEKSLIAIKGEASEFSLDDEIELFKRFRFSKVDQLKLTLTSNKLTESWLI